MSGGVLDGNGMTASRDEGMLMARQLGVMKE